MLGIPIYGNHQMFQCSRPKTHVDATPGSEDLALLGLHARSSGHGTHQRDLVAAGAGHVQRSGEGHVHLLTHAKPGGKSRVFLGLVTYLGGIEEANVVIHHASCGWFQDVSSM